MAATDFQSSIVKSLYWYYLVTKYWILNKKCFFKEQWNVYVDTSFQLTDE